MNLRVTIALAAFLSAACVELPQTALQRPPHRADAAVAPLTPDATAPAPLRIGTWNLRKLGFEQDKDIASIAASIERHFDLIALVEVVFSPDDADYAALAAGLGQGWQLTRTATPRPNLRSPHSEYYVVATRSARVAPCPEAPELAYVRDGEGSDDSPERGLFLREPAFGCFRTRGSGAGSDFVLAVYHAEWGDGSVSSIASEVAHLDLSFEAMQERFPQEREHFLLGDLNLDAAALAPLTSARDRTRGRGSTLDTGGRISEHLYDHLLALGQAAERALYDDAEVLDVRAEAIDPMRYRERISDHLPLVAQLRVAADDD
jgi:hypothetical protein